MSSLQNLSVEESVTNSEAVAAVEEAVADVVIVNRKGYTYHSVQPGKFKCFEPDNEKRARTRGGIGALRGESMFDWLGQFSNPRFHFHTLLLSHKLPNHLASISSRPIGKYPFRELGNSPNPTLDLVNLTIRQSGTTYSLVAELWTGPGSTGMEAPRRHLAASSMPET